MTPLARTFSSLPPLVAVVFAGIATTVFASASGKIESVTLPVAATALAALVVVVSEVFGSLLGASPENALLRLLVTMFVRAGGAAAAMLFAVLVVEAPPREVALVAIPLYFAMLGGEVYNALAATAVEQPNPAAGR